MAKLLATPRYTTDMRDESSRELPAETQATPRQAPLIHFQASEGPVTTQWVSGSPASMYGSDFGDVRGAYYSPAIHGAEQCLKGGSGFFARRMVSSAAKKSKLRLAIEVVADDIPKYLRGVDGKISRDITGTALVDGANVIPGYKLRWTVISGSTVGDIGSGVVVTGGTLTGGVGKTSSIYPVLDMEVNHFGKYGDDVGIRLYPALSTLSTPGDRNSIEFNKAQLYRAALVRRNVTTGTSIIRKTIDGSLTLDFSFIETAYDPKTNADLGVSRLLTAYENTDPTSGTDPIFGPFGASHVYFDNIETVLGLLHTAEEAAIGETIADKHLLNFMTAINYDGTENHAFTVASGGASLTNTNTHYAAGGVDGDVSFEVLGNLIISEIDGGWETPGDELRDVLRFPFTTVYDFGYPIDVKYALARALKLREDISIAIAVEDLSVNQYTAAEQDSVAQLLASYVASIPESVESGTGACRAVIYGQSGWRVNDKYKGRLSLIDNLIYRRAAYMGAASGKFKSAASYDSFPHNRLDGWSGVNNTYRDLAGHNKDWENGVNYVQFADQHSYFYPACQTVYVDDTSPLNSEFNMLIATNLKLVGARVWAMMTGNTKLKRAQFLAECERLAYADIDGAYDNRGSIKITAYITAKDDGLGYSWTMDFKFYAGTSKTVAAINVIVDREFTE